VESWISSGRIVPWIVALVVVEAGVLTWWRRRTGSGPAPGPNLANLAAGAALLLALGAALRDASWTWVAGFLGAALLAHLVDLGARWER
jgi:hypothetical protein